MVRHRPFLCAMVVVALLAGVAPADAGVTASQPSTLAGLHDPKPCPDVPDFTCATLQVPLDHSGGIPGDLDLAVSVADNADAPRGILLVLSGGPGQPGVSLVSRVRQYFAPEVLTQYRMVMFDQRGTGQAAISCEALQQAVGGSDFLTPPADAVADCASLLSERRHFFGSSDTVADIDLLRQALGAPQLTVDGVSYGTFTGAHYALRHPTRVRALVLDSVVPHSGFDPFVVDIMHATGRVLREACAEDTSCTTDPAADLAWLIRHGEIDGEPVNGTRFLESLAIMSLSTINPRFAGIPQLLHGARQGDTAPLKDFLNQASSVGTPADQLSAGLHIATVCADLTFPWGDSSTPVADRQQALDRALRSLDPAQLWPYDVATAARTLPIAGCKDWPVSRPSQYSPLDRLVVPTLLLAGDRDLFTPVEGARWEAAHATRGSLVVFDGLGHGVQGSRTDDRGRRATADFLLATH